MSFDAREAKLLKPGEHLTSPEHAGLRLACITRGVAWIYRYRSLVDQRLWQVKIGSRPSMSVHAAIVAWERLRDQRNAGQDPEQENRQARAQRAVEQKTIQAAVWYHQLYSTTLPNRPRPRLIVTHWPPHDLRRTARTLLAALGCPDEIGEVIIGHIKPGVKGAYNLYDADRMEWIKRLSNHLESLRPRFAGDDNV